MIQIQKSDGTGCWCGVVWVLQARMCKLSFKFSVYGDIKIKKGEEEGKVERTERVDKQWKRRLNRRKT